MEKINKKVGNVIIMSCSHSSIAHEDSVPIKLVQELGEKLGEVFVTCPKQSNK